MPSPIEETLERVYRRGRQLRFRRRALRCAAAALVVVAVALPVATVSDNHDAQNQRVATGPDSVVTTTSSETSSTSTAPEPSTSVPDTAPTTIAVTAATATTTAPRPTTTTAPRPTTTTALVCRNSTDSRCGPLRWDPAPGSNQPATVTVTYQPGHPVAGQEVVFTLVHSDADSDTAPIVESWSSGEGQSGGGTAVACAASEKFGAWTPPDPRPGVHTETLRHTYSRAGTFVARFRSVAGACGGDPYASKAEADVTVTILEQVG